MAQPEQSESREATPDEIERYEAGEQCVWECPECDHTVELLSAMAVACSRCRAERRTLVWMRRLDEDGVM